MADGSHSVEDAAMFTARLSRDGIDRAVARGEVRICHHGSAGADPETRHGAALAG